MRRLPPSAALARPNLQRTRFVTRTALCAGKCARASAPPAKARGICGTGQTRRAHSLEGLRMHRRHCERAMLEGPVTGGIHGWPFGRPIFDLASHGYVEEEFFLSGDAVTYRATAEPLPRDGRWQVEPKDALPFKTRFLVYRPADPKRFNGTVVVCWNNVTAGYELFHGESPEVLEGGYVYVAASGQR